MRGPKIDGTIVPPTGDWLIIMPDGSLRLDVRGTIKTDDGEIILVTYSGAFAASKEVMDRFNNGEVVTSKDATLITAPQFTTGSKKYLIIDYPQPRNDGTNQEHTVCFCEFERWRATRSSFKRASVRLSLPVCMEPRISAARR